MTKKRSTKTRQNFAIYLGSLALFFVIGAYHQHAKLLDHESATRHLDQMRPPASIEGLAVSEGGKADYVDRIPEETYRRVVYSQIRKDQAGWVIFDMLKAHSYAFANNITYGGACGDSVHKDDIREVLKSVGWIDILPLECPPPDSDTTRVYPSTFFEKKHGRRMSARAWREFIQNHTDYSYFDHHSHPDQSESPFSIVVHIRRRDVTPCCYPNWYLPNSYFASMITKFAREQEPGRPVEVHIFSQSDSHESFDDFSGKNYTLHLDGPVGEVWRAILSADIFIGSISEFSRVPALFAKGKLPDPRNISDPTIAAESKAGTQHLLDVCSDIQLATCKHQWWMDSSSSFSRQSTPKRQN